MCAFLQGLGRQNKRISFGKGRRSLFVLRVDIHQVGTCSQKFIITLSHLFLDDGSAMDNTAYTTRTD